MRARRWGMVYCFVRLDFGEESMGSPRLLGSRFLFRFEARVAGGGGGLEVTARERRPRLGLSAPGVMLSMSEKGVCSRDWMAFAIWDRGVRVGRELAGVSIVGMMCSSFSNRARRAARMLTRSIAVVF